MNDTIYSYKNSCTVLPIRCENNYVIHIFVFLVIKYFKILLIILLMILFIFPILVQHLNPAMKSAFLGKLTREKYSAKGNKVIARNKFVLHFTAI